MAHDRTYYTELGRRCGADSRVSAPALKEGSWQHRVFFEAYNAARSPVVAPPRGATGAIGHSIPEGGIGPMTGRFSAKPRAILAEAPTWRLINAAVIDNLMQGCDQAAAHHVGLLVKDHNTEPDERRRRRLHQAVVRMTVRHPLARHLSAGRRAHLEKEIRGEVPSFIAEAHAAATIGQSTQPRDIP